MTAGGEAVGDRHDAVERYLRAVVAAARQVLGSRFVGGYVGGSLALDAFQPGRSDIDVALVCDDPIDEAVKRALISRLRHDVLPCPARGLELVVYTAAAARSGTAAPAFELELNDGPDMTFRATLRPADRPVADGLFWYGLDRSILQQSGRVLAGPPAADLFTGPAPDALQDLLIDSVRWWRAQIADDEHPTDGADDAVLGACRALVHHRYGRWLSKTAAVRRLLTAGHRRAEIIDRAVAARSGAVPPTGRQARELQYEVLTELLAAS